MRIPKRIRRLDTEGLELTWSDGSVDTISSKVLRENCPAADAHGKSAPPEGKSSMLTVVDSSLEEQLKLVRIWGIGNYAIGIEWGDGHKTGIYSYDYLDELTRR